MQIPRLVRCSLFALLMVIIPATSFAGVFISVGFAPPVLPVYEQPPCPADGYMWVPGYWAYGPDGYYWVPGTWVMPPAVGLLWTPGYWGWGEGVYVWHAGYWGPHIGFYGGVNYGFGYFGTGYEGGYWRGNSFYYNRSVTNVTNITNVHIYNRTVINNVTVNRVSYNGGRGGIMARPTPEQERWGHERHFEPTHMQMNHEHAAGSNRAFWASENHGRPAVAATARPGEFHGRGVEASRPAGNFRQADDRGMKGRPDSGRAVPRPMARDDARGNRGGHDNSRWDSSPRPSSYHPENARQDRGRPENVRQENRGPERGRPENVRQENGHQRENAPRNDPHGNKGRDERPR